MTHEQKHRRPPRYMPTMLSHGNYAVYVVYDRQSDLVADGFYLTLADAQWAADQRNGKARIND
jgi:hypothetical protein